MPLRFRDLAIALLCFSTAVAQAQVSNNRSATEAVQAIGALDVSTEPMHLVETLTHRFGPRLTGSRQEHRAASWTVGEMKRSGLSNVHRESWTMHRGWTRLHAFAHLGGPSELELNVASYGWSGSTPGAVSGEVVLLDGDTELTESSTRGWKNKVVLVAPLSKDGVRGVADAPVLAAWAKKSHALAVIDGIVRPGGMLHTGPLGFPARETSVPVLDMPEAQRQQLERLVRQGVRPKLRLDVATRFSDGPVVAENVVGEIRGSAHPEQVVVVGAHLDSWDLSPGATDDGTGVAAVLAAARLIHDSGLRPDRTIRFVLFTGEEQGLLGSKAYVQQHRAELANIVCALVMDWGAGPITRFPTAGHPEMKSPLEELFQTVDTFKSVDVSSGFLTFTDGFAFTLAGLPGIGLLQASPTYDRDAHSTQDSLEEVNGPALSFNTKVLAQAAIWLADVSPRPGSRFTEDENAQALQPIKPLLQMLGAWPE